MNGTGRHTGADDVVHQDCRFRHVSVSGCKHEWQKADLGSVVKVGGGQMEGQGTSVLTKGGCRCKPSSPATLVLPVLVSPPQVTTLPSTATDELPAPAPHASYAPHSPGLVRNEHLHAGEGDIWEKCS